MTYKQEVDFSSIVAQISYFTAQVHFDLLHVIAYGPTVAKVAAANLLFLYWPSLNPTPAERKVSSHSGDAVLETSHCLLPPLLPGYCGQVHCRHQLDLSHLQ